MLAGDLKTNAPSPASCPPALPHLIKQQLSVLFHAHNVQRNTIIFDLELYFFFCCCLVYCHTSMTSSVTTSICDVNVFEGFSKLQIFSGQQNIFGWQNIFGKVYDYQFYHSYPVCMLFHYIKSSLIPVVDLSSRL